MELQPFDSHDRLQRFKRSSISHQTSHLRMGRIPGQRPQDSSCGFSRQQAEQNDFPPAMAARETMSSPKSSNSSVLIHWLEEALQLIQLEGDALLCRKFHHPLRTLHFQDSRAFRSDDDGLRSTVQRVLLVFPRFTANAFPLPCSAMAAQHQARDFANI